MRSMLLALPLHLDRSPSIQRDELRHSQVPPWHLPCAIHTINVTNTTSARHQPLPAPTGSSWQWSPSAIKLSYGVTATRPQSSFRGGSPSYRGGQRIVTSLKQICLCFLFNDFPAASPFQPIMGLHSLSGSERRLPCSGWRKSIPLSLKSLQDR